MVYTYDVLGEQLTETGYDGAVTTTAVLGRTREVTDGNGRHFIYESDELGRLLRVRQPVTAAPNWTISYTYDLADNLLTATGPNNAVTTMTYDKLGRKLTMNDPDMGFWSYGYDGSGNLARQTDAGNRRLCFYYDAANRPTSKRHDGTGIDPCPAMWGGTLLANYTYHSSGAGKGMPASIAGGSGAAEAQKISAAAEAEAIRLRGQALQDNPSVLQLEFVQQLGTSNWMMVPWEQVQGFLPLQTPGTPTTIP